MQLFCYGSLLLSFDFSYSTMCVQIILSSVKVAERSSFGSELVTLLTVCSTCNRSVLNFIFPHFGFRDRSLVLIVQVPVQCLPLTFV